MDSEWIEEGERGRAGEKNEKVPER